MQRFDLFFKISKHCASLGLQNVFFSSFLLVFNLWNPFQCLNMIWYSSQTSIRYCAIFDHTERLIFNSHQNLEGHCFTHLSNSGEHGSNNKIMNVCCVMKKIIKSFYSKFEGLLVPERKRHCIWMETNGEWRPCQGSLAPLLVILMSVVGGRQRQC